MATGRRLTRKQAADELQVSTKTIDRLREAGELDWFPVRARVLIKGASVDAYEARQEQRCKRHAGSDPVPIPTLDRLREQKRADRAALGEKDAA